MKIFTSEKSIAVTSGVEPARRPVKAADVIVVGAGPAGSTAAYYLARAGLDVLLLEKTTFPREKVCGDGLTPHAVKHLLQMGIDVAAPGWFRNKGLRIIGGGTRLELDWPQLDGFPDFGLTRTRQDFDELLANHAVAAGARLRTETIVTEPLLDRAGRVAGVHATVGSDKITYPAKLVLAADGVSARFALALGLAKRNNRPVGVAIRRYYHSPRHNDEYLETWHDVPVPRQRGRANGLLNGYGWIFPLGDGRCNVGLGAWNQVDPVESTPDYRRVLESWLADLPAVWGFTENHIASPIRGAGLPMGFNRKPHYTRGVMLLGDAGGMVNPFSGEGIAYAMESGYIAAKLAAHALRRAAGPAREHVLRAYPRLLRYRWGGYFRLCLWLSRALANPRFVQFALLHLFTRPAVMHKGLRMAINLVDPESKRSKDRLLTTVSKLVPAA